MGTIYPYGVDPFQTYTQHVTMIDASLATDWKDSIQAIQTEQLRTYNPDLKPVTAHGYNDEFESGALDAKWTASNCASGTVDLLSTAAAKDTYDATMYTGMMALQPGRDDDKAAGMEAEAAILHQTVVLSATCKVVAKLHFLAPLSLVATDDLVAGILLSGANGFNDNDYIAIARAGTSPAGLSWGVSRIGGGAVTTLSVISDNNYAMITKTGNDFSVWLGDGHSWTPGTDIVAAPDVQVFTHAAGVMVRLSLFCYWGPAAAEVNSSNPIAAFDFIRYFTNNTPLVNV